MEFKVIDVDFGSIVGVVMSRVEQKDNDRIEFEAADGRMFVMQHYQDCCECVVIEDLCGYLQDLVGEPILLAEAVSGEMAQPDGWDGECGDFSCTWTFYKLATRKGYVDIRWLGTSNGYYSEEVSFVQLVPRNA